MSCVIPIDIEGFLKVKVDVKKMILEFCQSKKQRKVSFGHVCIGKHETRTTDIHVTILKKKRQLSKKWPTTNIIEK